MKENARKIIIFFQDPAAAGSNGNSSLATPEERSIRPVAIILTTHIAVVVLWQLLVDGFRVPAFVLPSPLATVATLGSYVLQPVRLCKKEVAPFIDEIFSRR